MTQTNVKTYTTRKLRRVAFVDIVEAAPDAGDSRMRSCDTIGWQYKGDQGWKMVSQYAHAPLEEGFSQGQESCSFDHHWEHHNPWNGKRDRIDHYTFDLKAFTQTNVRAKTERQIRRVGIREVDLKEPVPQTLPPPLEDSAHPALQE